MVVKMKKTLLVLTTEALRHRFFNSVPLCLRGKNLLQLNVSYLIFAPCFQLTK